MSGECYQAVALQVPQFGCFVCDAVAILSPVGLKQTLVTGSLCPVNVTKQLPCKSHNLAVLSDDAVAIASPVGLKLTLVTESLCPVNVTKELPCKSHNLAVLSVRQ